MLPSDWREQVTAMVAGKQPLTEQASGQLFAGGPVLSPVEQIGVYANQYRIRLYEALEEEVIGLRALLGDALKPTLWRYLEDCPSTSWTLERVADGLEDWLRAQGAPVAQVEMAALDRAVQRGFIAGDPQPLTAEQLATLPPLQLTPPTQLLRLTTNVHDVRSALRAGDVVDLQTGTDVPLVVFRQGRSLQTLVLEPAAFRLLAAFRDGVDVGSALEALVLEGLVEPEAVATSVQRWFRDFAAHGLVQVRSDGAERP